MTGISPALAFEVAETWETMAEMEAKSSPDRRATLRECADMVRMLATRATPPATPIAEGFGSSPDGDTQRAAETAVVALEYRTTSLWRNAGCEGRRVKQAEREFLRGIYSSLEVRYSDGQTVTNIAAPASDTTARYEPEASEPKDAARRDEGAGQ